MSKFLSYPSHPGSHDPRDIVMINSLTYRTESGKFTPSPTYVSCRITRTDRQEFCRRTAITFQTPYQHLHST